jgi:hypothetical protein
MFDAFVSARRGDTAAARGFIAALRTFTPSPTTPGTAVASGYFAMMVAQLGDRETALQVLEAARPRGLRLHDLLRRSDFDGIRSDPRFARLFEETLPPGARW